MVFPSAASRRRCGKATTRLLWLHSLQDLYPLVKTPSRFNVARFEDPFALLEIDAQTRSGIDQSVERHGNRRWQTNGQLDVNQPSPQRG